MKKKSRPQLENLSMKWFKMINKQFAVDNCSFLDKLISIGHLTIGNHFSQYSWFADVKL